MSVMADNTLFAGSSSSLRSEIVVKSSFNKNCSEFRPRMSALNPSPPIAVLHDEEDLSTVGSALGELLVQVSSGKGTPCDSVSPSPMPSTAQVTPQMSAVLLPPPPGYDPIVEPATLVCEENSSFYDVGSSSWQPSYPPPPFHLGFKLFVGALPYAVCEGDLFPLFSQFGEILELHIQRDWVGRSKGCAWLRYSTMEECDAAIDALHNNYFLGSMNRPMQLTYASDSSDRKVRAVGSNSSSEVPGVSSSTSCSRRSRAMTAEQSFLCSTSSVVEKLRTLIQQPDPPLVPSIESVSSSSPLTAAFSGRRFTVTGFPMSFDDCKVKELFTQFGPVVSAERVHLNEVVVEFEFPRDAERARSVIDGVTLPFGNDTPLTVRPSSGHDD